MINSWLIKHKGMIAHLEWLGIIAMPVPPQLEIHKFHLLASDCPFPFEPPSSAWCAIALFDRFRASRRGYDGPSAVWVAQAVPLSPSALRRCQDVPLESQPRSLELPSQFGRRTRTTFSCRRYQALLTLFALYSLLYGCIVYRMITSVIALFLLYFP
jgi:hypothetical protein